MKHKCERHRWIVMQKKNRGVDMISPLHVHMWNKAYQNKTKTEEMKRKRKEKEGKLLCNISLSLQPSFHLEKFLDPRLIPLDVLNICRAINTHTEFHQD